MKAKFAALLSFLLALAGAGTASAKNENHEPAVPPSLEAPAGNKMSFRAYAVGVQIYIAMPSPANPNQLVWSFTAPEAVLLDSHGHVVGSHYAYAGPTRPAWESMNGGLVVCSRTVPPVTVDANAIPWLLLDAVQTEGPGIFRHTTHIQRVNTTGGLAPSTPPAYAGQEARVPYTADYIFYRAHPVTPKTRHDSTKPKEDSRR